MFGHGLPVPEPCGVWDFGVVVDGVVVVGVVVVGVLLVDWVLVEALGAAAAPAIPAAAPPVASAPTTIPVLIMLALLIGEPPMGCWCRSHQPCWRARLSGPEPASKR